MRDQILTEIKRLAEANGGQPPGHCLFASQTGIGASAWRGVYWARWGDAVKEAGIEPNVKQERFDEQLLFKKLAEACRHYERLPTAMEIRMYGKIDPEFPTDRTIARRFRSKANMVNALSSWVSANKDYADVAAMLQDHLEPPSMEPTRGAVEGLVYLIKSGAHYKIGRSDELERRVKEIRIALPEAASLVHSIRTDDPAGIEAYWHRRFADKRANGEWFKLTNADVAAVKKRKYQ